MKLRDTLKEFLQKPYESIDSFLENVIFPVFGEDNFVSAGNGNVLRRYPDLQTIANDSGILSLIQVGYIFIDGQELNIFDIKVNSHRQLSRSRVAIQSLVRKLISTYSSAFMIFHYDTMEGRWDWRFTFCQKGASNADSTDAKRYTFLLGPSQSCRTAADNFMKIYEKIEREGELEIDDIVRAFDVEALSKEFFDKYVHFYKEYFVKYMCDEANGMRQDFITTDFDHTGLTSEQIKDKEEKPIRDYLKKLLGRLVFLQFLQKKGWMGVPVDKEWGEGNYDFLRQLFLHATPEQKDNFLDGVLEPLFTALDTKRTDDIYDTQVPGIGKVKIPYLNGGLFERDSADEPDTKFPAEYFDKLFEFFYEYNFTIDENDPQDAEVGVDPEMLGKIFESQLEDNKDKGAFYTPKEIVQYMCKESLIAYLISEAQQGDNQSDDAIEEKVRVLVDNPEAAIDKINSYDITLLQVLNDALVDVKICDPAIGSGAFPMGLLNLLFRCRLVVNEALNVDAHPAELKKEIIQNNIYGVDIEKGAIDIARLRFWLSIVVDLEEPETLPNFDYKFMQGNSLLEQYEGIDLSGVGTGKQKKKATPQLSFEYDEKLIKENIQTQLKQYFTLQGAEKACCKEDINNSVKSYIKCLTEGQGLERQEQILSDLDISANDKFFLWHTWFADVFNRPSKQGFDIVIGNPPFIDSETMTRVMPELREIYSKKYTCARGNWDIFVPFIELGVNLLNSSGTYSFIIPNKLIAAKYTETLRTYIAQNSIFEMRDYGNVPVFVNAAVYPATIIGGIRADKLNNIHFSVMKNISDKSIDNVISAKQFANIDFWDICFQPSEYYNLFTKINSHQLLKEDTSYTIAGAATVSEAYLIKEILKDNENLCDGIKMINTGTIDKYINLWGTAPMQYIKGRYQYPMVNETDLAHINQKRLEQAKSCKIIVAGMSKFIEAIYDDGNTLAGKSTTIILGESNRLKYLLAILNSSLASFFTRIAYNSLKMAGGFINIGCRELENIPINASSSQQQPIIKIVDKILTIKQSNPLADTSSLEKEIDNLVYQLYELTPDEIALIEQAN